MDISTIGTVTAITAICYIAGTACKASEQVKDEWIPVIMAILGGALGALGMSSIPGFPATDYITAVAVGMMSGLGATGINQVYKQNTGA